MDLHQIIKYLAKRRPIFHSEADFQHELAWEIHNEHQDANIRIEKPHNINGERRFIDIVAHLNEKTYFIELKYKTSETSIISGDELFNLKQQGAHDQGSYDFIKDIQRVEESAACHKNGKGFSVMLTNDSKYWTESKKETIIYRDFQLLESRKLKGELKWESHAGKGSIKNREYPIILSGTHEINWCPYSSPQNINPFRYLIIPI